MLLAVVPTRGWNVAQVPSPLRKVVLEAVPEALKSVSGIAVTKETLPLTPFRYPALAAVDPDIASSTKLWLGNCTKILLVIPLKFQSARYPVFTIIDTKSSPDEKTNPP